MAFNYNGSLEEAMAAEKLYIDDGLGNPIKAPIVFKTQRPEDPGNPGQQRDQTNDAALHMRYAHSLGLPELRQRVTPRRGRALIIGGAPSVKDYLDEIKKLGEDPSNTIIAVNWSHAWLLDQGVVPNACVFFEIDPEPDSCLVRAHPDVTYYICSHCHQKTFDSLKDYKRVLWHTPPNSEPEKEVGEELFKGSALVGGGISTFTRAITVALYLGYRHLDLYGCDSSFPEDSKTTHVEGYETPMSVETDSFYVYARNDATKEVKRFRTVGYLALQVEEFKEYCLVNHQYFSCEVHGDGLLKYVHKNTYPDQYENNI